MSRKPKNIFLHFLNKDTQEIFGVDTQRDQMALALLRKGLNASVLLCDAETFCFLPLGFWFESSYTKALLTKCSAFVAEGYVRFSIREENLQVFIDKKRQQYSPLRKTVGIYQNFFDKTALQCLESLKPIYLSRWSKIGEECSTIWRADHTLLLSDNSGDLEQIYSMIPDMDTREKIAKVILNAASNQETPFVWKNIQDIIANLPIRDSRLERALRIYFEKNYYDVYLKEYNATNLFYFSLIDRGIQFHSVMQPDTIANYTWFKTFLEQLSLEAVLSAQDRKIVKIRQSSAWADLQEVYIQACNDTQRRIGTACAAALRNTEVDVKNAAEAVRDILSTNKGVLIVPQQKKSEFVAIKKDTVDVLVMVATLAEEQAITENTKWESRKTSTGYEYFIRTEGRLHIALARSINMGPESAAGVTQFYVSELNPHFLAMAGFCAGKRGEVQLGDVVVPVKVYRYDVGKQVSASEVLPEMDMFRLDDLWKQKVERFGDKWRESVTIPRPITYESQYYFLLKALMEQNFSVDIRKMKSNQALPNITQIIAREIQCGKMKLVGGMAVATEEGAEAYNYDFLINYPMEYKDPELKLRVGVLATGDRVQAWDGVFQELEKKLDRKTCVLDMEGSAIAGISSFNHIPYIIAKGVGDFASEMKAFDNRYISYAVFSSYQFIVAFFNSLTDSESIQVAQ